MRFSRLAACGLLLFSLAFAADTGYKVPRLPDGHPDLQGTYDLATLTPVERPRGQKATLTPEEALKVEKAAADHRSKEDAPIAADRKAPPKGGDGTPGPYGNVGGYNYGWLDPGSTYMKVDGQIRSSLVIDPPDGRVPPFNAKGLERMKARGGRATADQVETNDPGLEKAPGAYDDPERRDLGERCLIGFGSTTGPPALPDYFYDNLHRIVQTRDTVVILSEMVHDARIVRMNGQHLPPTIRNWFGDSIGHWEGDTLVVDTTNFADQTAFRGASRNLHVVERFTRVSNHELLYKFTVEDPDTWDKPWSGEYTWPATNEHIYEYACHEANYAMGDVLRGARLREKEEAEGRPGK